LVSQIDFNQVVLRGMLAFLLFAGSIQVSIINPTTNNIRYISWPG